MRKIFRKTNISNPLIRARACAYQGVRNVSFSESFAYVLNGWPRLVPLRNISCSIVNTVKNYSEFIVKALERCVSYVFIVSSIFITNFEGVFILFDLILGAVSYINPLEGLQSSNHIEASQLTCFANQLVCFYMIKT